MIAATDADAVIGFFHIDQATARLRHEEGHVDSGHGIGGQKDQANARRGGAQGLSRHLVAGLQQFLAGGDGKGLDDFLTGSDDRVGEQLQAQEA